MGLADYIRANKPAIIREWENFARSLRPASGMTALQLKDHVDQILTFIARDIDATQSAAEQFDKSRGLAPDTAGPTTAAEVHGTLRHDDGYDIMEMVSEYRALRASVIKLWTSQNKLLSDEDVVDLTRFNEAIDQALAESVVTFSKNVDRSKDLILGVLGHDIRSPLATIHMSAEILKHISAPNEREAALIAQIEASTLRVRHIVADLLDMAKARLGSGIPISVGPLSLSQLTQSIVAEMRIQHPQRAFTLNIAPDIMGRWDGVRLGQVISNLLSNAMQYGREGVPVSVALSDSGATASLSVHNEGEPIPPTHLDTIFKSFTRVPGTLEDVTGMTQNLGLGLFISREIVTAHGGTIRATSTAADGTTFTVVLPKGDEAAAFR